MIASAEIDVRAETAPHAQTSLGLNPTVDMIMKHFTKPRNCIMIVGRVCKVLRNLPAPRRSNLGTDGDREREPVQISRVRQGQEGQKNLIVETKIARDRRRLRTRKQRSMCQHDALWTPSRP